MSGYNRKDGENEAQVVPDTPSHFLRRGKQQAGGSQNQAEIGCVGVDIPHERHKNAVLFRIDTILKVQKIELEIIRDAEGADQNRGYQKQLQIPALKLSQPADDKKGGAIKKKQKQPREPQCHLDKVLTKG